MDTSDYLLSTTGTVPAMHVKCKLNNYHPLTGNICTQSHTQNRFNVYQNNLLLPYNTLLISILLFA